MLRRLAPDGLLKTQVRLSAIVNSPRKFFPFSYFPNPASWLPFGSRGAVLARRRNNLGESLGDSEAPRIEPPKLPDAPPERGGRSGS
jgi:hypothetical protein